MLIHDLYESPDRYRGHLVARHYVGSNGRAVAPQHADLVSKHVKKASTPRGQYDHVVNQYNNDWYWHTNLGHNIASFDDLKNILSRYYTFGSSSAVTETATGPREMLPEIQRSKSHDQEYSADNRIISPSLVKQIKKIPGQDRYGYIFGAAMSMFTGATHAIRLYDLKNPEHGVYEAGWMSLKHLSGFPMPRSHQVSNIKLDQQYRGQGLGQTLYGIAMKSLGMTILADAAQTPESRKMWANISRVPGVEVFGYASVFSSDWEKRNNPDAIADEEDARTIGRLLRVGGQEIGQNSTYTYVRFPVQADSARGELKAPNGLSIYSARHPEQGGTDRGLYARWTGQ
jgi:ribosomal protein S18 acetylase RimI-like enzyme